MNDETLFDTIGERKAPALAHINEAAINHFRATDFSDIPTLVTKCVASCIAVVILADDGRAAIYHSWNASSNADLLKELPKQFRPQSSHVFLIGGQDITKYPGAGYTSVDNVQYLERNLARLRFKVEGSYLYGPETNLDISITPDQTIHLRESFVGRGEAPPIVTHYPKGAGLPGKLAPEEAPDDDLYALPNSKKETVRIRFDGSGKQVR